jgi:hypothetical protein
MARSYDQVLGHMTKVPPRGARQQLESLDKFARGVERRFRDVERSNKGLKALGRMLPKTASGHSRRFWHVRCTSAYPPLATEERTS